MPNTHNNLTSLFSDIADAIRAKTGENRLLTADEFPDEIDAIQTGGGSGYSITVSGSHFTYDAPSTIGEDNIAEISFTPESGYELSFAVTGATIRSVDYTTYEMLIENPTGAVSVAVTAVQPDYFWIENVGMSNVNVSKKQGYMYSTDKINWSSTSKTVVPNEKLYYKGFNGSTYGNSPSIPSSGFINIGGNAYTLVTPSGIVSGTNWSLQSCFYNTTAIVDASELTLSETVLTNNCYKSMFSACTSLTTAPELPATTLADGCYEQMFQGCSALTTAPELPATTLAENCYKSMFSGCALLTTVPALPATTLASSCYQSMFSGCIALKVYSESGEGHTVAWTIPTTGTLQGDVTYYMTDIFRSVETDNVPATLICEYGHSYTFYTQNTPV